MGLKEDENKSGIVGGLGSNERWWGSTRGLPTPGGLNHPEVGSGQWEVPGVGCHCCMDSLYPRFR